MRKLRTLCMGMGVVAALLALPALAGPQNLDSLLKSAKKALHEDSDAFGEARNLPDSEIAAGLKEALAQGTRDAIAKLGQDGGFWDNANVRIPLPGPLEKVGKLARQLGQGEKVDAFQLSLNRAAEKAVPEVADIFGDAIRQMSLKDARGILTGGDHAATDYFRRVAGEALATRIEPIVEKTTDSVGVTRRYKALTDSAGGSSLGGMLGQLGGDGDKSLDLDKYVTDKAIDGLFTEIAAQEAAIRENPAARTTDLLKKVFGAR